ncbi:MAG: O-antigen ligase family protein [Phycisphaeraceae bacterium]
MTNFGLQTSSYTLAYPQFQERTTLVGLYTLGVGLMVLLVGYATPDLRLMVYDIPLNPLIFAFAALSLFVCRGQVFGTCLLYWLPLLVCLVPLLWSPNPDYGRFKAFNFLATTLIASALLGEAVAQLGLVRFQRALVVVLLALLLAAVVFKARYGFFDRQVHFFMNGPIVFARLMGIGAVMAFFGFQRVMRWALVLLFVAAMIWTSSKGPVVALLAMAGLLCLMRFWNWRRGMILLMIGVISFTAYLNRETMLEMPVLNRYAMAMDPDDARNRGSLHHRLELWDEAVQKIRRYPFTGTGLGGGTPYEGERQSGYRVGQGAVSYPHNLPLEVFSEMGLIFGAVFMVPFLLLLRSPFSPMGACALYLLLASMTTGDILDGRYPAVWAMLASLALVLQRDGTISPGR